MDKYIQLGSDSLKGLNKTVGEELSRFSENNYDSFIDLYLDLLNNSTIKKSDIDKLIKIGSFEEFGSVPFLLGLIEVFSKYLKRKTIKKIEIPDSPFQECDIRTFSEKETEKQFSKVDMPKLISLTASNMNKSLNNSVQSSRFVIPMYQTEIVGIPINDIDFSEEELAKYEDTLCMVYLVSQPNWAYGNYIVNIYRLASGEFQEYTIKKGVFEKTPLKEGQIIQAISSSERKLRYGRIETTLTWRNVVIK